MVLVVASNYLSVFAPLRQRHRRRPARRAEVESPISASGRCATNVTTDEARTDTTATCITVTNADGEAGGAWPILVDSIMTTIGSEVALFTCFLARTSRSQ